MNATMKSINEKLCDLQNKVIDDEMTVDQFIETIKEFGLYDQMLNDFNGCVTNDMFEYITESMTDWISSI